MDIMISTNEFLAIEALDLEPIKVKLMHKESGEGWTLEYANMIEIEYRRFLYLMKKYPNETAAPLFDVDIFWHYHILDTMSYAQDCESVFGYFLHHFPYAGLRGEDDEAAHNQIGIRMQELYEETFNESYMRFARGELGDIAFASANDGAGNAQVRTPWSFSPAKQTAGMGSKTAWSSALGNDAGTGRKATHAPVSDTAPRAPTMKTAWSFAPGRADATLGTKIAWSFAPSKNAGATASNTAWSFAVGTAANRSRQQHPAASQPGFNLERPRLPS
jgi:hypothetical protein